MWLAFNDLAAELENVTCIQDYKCIHPITIDLSLLSRNEQMLASNYR